MTPFRPHPWTAGGHRQTLLGHWLRRRLVWRAPVEDVVLDPEDGVRLLLRATWQARPEERPTLLVVHGLGGCDAAGYAVATGTLAHARGWNVVRMNMRGAGDSEPLCARLYHAGLDADFMAALRFAAERSRSVSVVGFSLGANLALLACGRRAAEVPEAVRALVGICPPLDLAHCADAIDAPPNRAYQAFFLRDLRAAYARRQRRLPERYAAGRERPVRSIREYDAAITAPYGGYRDVDDYYARSSAGPWIAHLTRPTLVLAAADDPLVPVDSVTRWPLGTAVEREVTPTGGHVGFVAPSAAPGRFWAAERALEWLSAVG